MKHIIERSYLVRRVERYEIEMADEADPEEFIEHHFHSFDTEVISAGVLQRVREETVDYSELKLAVVDRASAKIIPMRRKRESNEPIPPP